MLNIEFGVGSNMLLGKELAMDFKSTPLPAPPAPKMSTPNSGEAVVNPRDQLKLIEPLNIELFMQLFI